MKTGQTAGQPNQKSDVIATKHTMPTAAIAGSLKRKMPSVDPYACGTQEQVAITHGRSTPGKQTWKGASEGYTTRKAPEYVASPAKASGQDTASKSKSGPQRVK